MFQQEFLSKPTCQKSQTCSALILVRCALHEEGVCRPPKVGLPLSYEAQFNLMHLSLKPTTSPLSKQYKPWYLLSKKFFALLHHFFKPFCKKTKSEAMPSKRSILFLHLYGLWCVK